MQESENVPIIMNCLGHKGLRLVQTLNDWEQEKCKTGSGLLEGLNEKFKPQHETILSLKQWKLVREEKESAIEWMTHQTIKANKCEYKDGDLK